MENEGDIVENEGDIVEMRVISWKPWLCHVPCFRPRPPVMQEPIRIERLFM